MRIENNVTITTYDVAELLKDESGQFLVQRAGQSFLVESEPGHSIRSFAPIGDIEPTATLPGSNPPWRVSRISQPRLDQSQQGAAVPEQQRQSVVGHR